MLWRYHLSLNALSKHIIVLVSSIMIRIQEIHFFLLHFMCFSSENRETITMCASMITLQFYMLLKLDKKQKLFYYP